MTMHKLCSISTYMSKKTGCELRYSGIVSSSCFTSGTIRVNLVINSVLSNNFICDICVLVSNMISISDDVPEYLSLSTAFSEVRVAQSLISFCVLFCTSLFVLFLLTCLVCELRYSGIVSSSCFTSGTIRVNLVTNSVLSNK
jgi:hypothetical protein